MTEASRENLLSFENDVTNSSPAFPLQSKIERLTSHVVNLREENSHLFSFFSDADAFLEETINRILTNISGDYLLKRSEEEITETVIRILSLFVNYCQTPNTIPSKFNNALIEVLEEPNAIGIALSDRPFIVSTVAECLRAQGHEIRLFIHPILEYKGERISTSYIELNNVSLNRLHGLLPELRMAIQELTVITGDFSSMLMKLDSIASSFERSGPHMIDPNYSSREIGQFIRWLLDESFILCGYTQWNEKEDGGLTAAATPRFGVFDSILKDASSQLIQECLEDVEDLVRQGTAISIRKTHALSQTLRRLPFNHIVVREPVEDAGPVRIHSIIGLFSSKALRDESRDVPLVRVKLRDLIDQERVFDNSYDYSYVVDTINRMPKDLALRLSVPDLKEITDAGIRVYHGSEVHVSCFYEPGNKGASVVVLLSRDKFNRELKDKIQEYITATFDVEGSTCEYHLDFSLHPQTRLYFYVPFLHGGKLTKKLNLVNAQTQIVKLTRTWEDNLREALDALCESNSDLCLLARFDVHFPLEYQATHTIDEAVQAIRVMTTLTADNPIAVMLEEDRGRPESQELGDEATVILFRLGEEIRVSSSLPVLDNIGLETTNSTSFRVEIEGQPAIYIHRLRVRTLPRISFLQEEKHLYSVLNNHHFFTGLTQILSGQAASDRLNGLLLDGNVSIKSISLLRAYSLFLWQANKFATRRSTFDALAASPTAASLLWEIFDTRFNPNLKGNLSPEEREQLTTSLLEKFHDTLQNIADITTDRILRSVAELILNTTRTNFYAELPYLALKFHSEKIDILPQPKPKFEIYVSSPEFEGIHLRTSMVARGGIRWSERPEDFRTEILGLMKTQKVKNVLIVPSGAKGGFVVRNLPRDPREIQAKVTSCYKDFVRALLSVTDNKVEGQLVRPSYLIIYDYEDPYFVVAADKGTSTFSDLANEIAVNEFNFWLGDAFASGGSNGYDHKKYGITAKGAWECVKRHFCDLGIDYIREPFSVVGIGDMSGDVFGNGLLLSKNAKLIAAFNHKHIFIDPTPDPLVSYRERERLFNLPRSQWSDYDLTLISSGGGVFNRFDKAIKLSPKAREALGLLSSGDSLNGEELIAHILKAPCDLLWNGGIGTYVKSLLESHADVNDGTNDRVRINADELRARVVGEGGNLGFTQRARIEYSLKGGHINTDAIDNSAGVDLSDHEVNIKILCSSLIKKGALTVEERNSLLEKMAHNVEVQVLSHNHSHATMLSLAVERSLPTLSFFQSLLRNLGKMGYINRPLDVLPEDDQLLDRAKKKIGLCRPELAICLAAVKMWIKDTLLGTGLCNDVLLSRYLLNYFPERLREMFSDEILRHPLATHIIATEVTNTVVDAVGISFVHRMCLNHGVTAVTVIKCTLAAELLLNMEQLRTTINRFDNPDQNDTYLHLRAELSNSLRDATAWLLHSHGTQLTLREMVDLYSKDYHFLVTKAQEILDWESRENYTIRLEKLQELGLDSEAGTHIALLPSLLKVFEILWGAKQSSASPLMIASTRNSVKRSLKLSSVYKISESFESDSKWEQQALAMSYQSFKRLASLIACRLVTRGCLSEEEIQTALEASYGYEDLIQLIDEVCIISQTTVPALMVLEKRLRRFYENMT
jgi:glutamate dehydrogenase